MKSVIKSILLIFLISIVFASIVFFSGCETVVPSDDDTDYDPCPNGVPCAGGCCNNGTYCGTDNMCHSTDPCPNGVPCAGGCCNNNTYCGTDNMCHTQGCTPTGCPGSHPWYGCGSCWTTSDLCHSRGTSNYRDDCSVCLKCP